MTKAQKAALDWLRAHNGTGVFDRNGVLLAGGELAPFTRATWNALRDAGHVWMRQNGNGRRRLGPARVAVTTPAEGRT